MMASSMSRESEAWAEVTIPEAGISEPASDGTPYARTGRGRANGRRVGRSRGHRKTLSTLMAGIDAIEGKHFRRRRPFVEAPDDGADLRP